MFQKVLVANRGEIAVRIIRALKEMGIFSVAVFSQPDRDALHVQLADEAVCIGPAKASESYLNMESILSAADLTRAEAVHPGFGFLAENPVFAGMCRDCNIKFIGPDSKTIEGMGNKTNARRLMIAAGVPVIPGSEGAIETGAAALEWGERIGYPLMVKASAGGGGKGIRKVYRQEELESAFISAQSEAKAAFGNDSIYMEKLIEGARHIEVQILADEFGNIIHLGERDCSMQRRNQKMLEESPAFGIDENIRKSLGETAVQAAKAVGYKNAGTIEFLYDKGQFYFMEMNTRIQVEHPVTELATGIDLVKEQIRIAMGQRLSVSQEDVRITGHTIECRINAESIERNFAPSPGKINYLFLPGGTNGIRVDTAAYAGYTIPPYYDSMIAKIIAKGADRQEAVARMKRALGELVVKGVDTNTDFQMEILNHPLFLSGGYDTTFIENSLL